MAPFFNGTLLPSRCCSHNWIFTYPIPALPTIACTPHETLCLFLSSAYCAELNVHSVGTFNGAAIGLKFLCMPKAILYESVWGSLYTVFPSAACSITACSPYGRMVGRSGHCVCLFVATLSLTGIPTPHIWKEYVALCANGLGHMTLCSCVPIQQIMCELPLSLPPSLLAECTAGIPHTHIHYVWTIPLSLSLSLPAVFLPLYLLAVLLSLLSL